jgi:hypothetical protein
MYCTGAGVVPNLAEPVKWYRRAAEGGDRYAQYNLSVMLLKGQGTAPDTEEAFRWCSAAAEQGLPEAQVQLGELHGAGLATQKDIAVRAGSETTAEPFYSDFWRACSTRCRGCMKARSTALMWV